MPDSTSDFTYSIITQLSGENQIDLHFQCIQGQGLQGVKIWVQKPENCT